MGKKANTDFLAAFIELETACNGLLGCKRSGVTEYINELNSVGSISGKSEVLQKLLAYRKIRNKLAHEEGALADVKSISSEDVRWLRKFKKDVERRRDPISLDRKVGWLTPKRIVGLGAIAAAVLVVVLGAIIFLTK